MPESARTAADGVCAQMRAQRLPRWRELPDLDLYMDQVLSLIARWLGDYPGSDAKGLTASMVNNYVKQGAMPPPVKKRYGRAHLAHLIVICVLKPVLPIASIRAVAQRELARTTEERAYDRFCELFEEAVAAAADNAAQDLAANGQNGVSGVCHAALRAQSEKAMALRLAALAEKQGK